MSTEIYEDMDQEYRSRIFLARKKLTDSLEGATLLPENGLAARFLLTEEQLKKVELIRKRRLVGVIDRFIPDRGMVAL
jgi:hypothetical protein